MLLDRYDAAISSDDYPTKDWPWQKKLDYLRTLDPEFRVFRNEGGLYETETNIRVTFYGLDRNRILIDECDNYGAMINRLWEIIIRREWSEGGRINIRKIMYAENGLDAPFHPKRLGLSEIALYDAADDCDDYLDKIRGRDHLRENVLGNTFGKFIISEEEWEFDREAQEFKRLGPDEIERYNAATDRIDPDQERLPWKAKRNYLDQCQLISDLREDPGGDCTIYPAITITGDGSTREDYPRISGQSPEEVITEFWHTIIEVSRDTYHGRRLLGQRIDCVPDRETWRLLGRPEFMREYNYDCGRSNRMRPFVAVATGDDRHRQEEYVPREPASPQTALPAKAICAVTTMPLAPATSQPAAGTPGSSSGLLRARVRLICCWRRIIRRERSRKRKLAKMDEVIAFHAQIVRDRATSEQARSDELTLLRILVENRREAAAELWTSRLVEAGKVLLLLPVILIGVILAALLLASARSNKRS